MAQPSSAMKCRKAVAAAANDSLKNRNGCSCRFRSSIFAVFATPCRFPQYGKELASQLGSLNVIEELTDLRFQALGLDGERVGEILDAGGRGTRAGRRAGDAAHRIRAPRRMRGSPLPRWWPPPSSADRRLPRPLWRWTTSPG